MSITRRILEGAQSGLSKLTSLVIVDDEPLSHVESAALQAELTARKAARAKSPQAAARQPAREAGARATRRRGRRATRPRRIASARVHRERDEREAKPAGGRRRSVSPDEGASGARRRRRRRQRRQRVELRARPPRPGTHDAQLAEWYRVLDLDAGADMAQIKTSYRQLMRKYHPDMHAGNPQKQKAATELSMRVTTAYNGLVAHLEKK